MKPSLVNGVALPKGALSGVGPKNPRLKNPKSAARVYPWPRAAGQDAYKMGSDAGLSLTANCTGAYADRRFSSRVRPPAAPLRPVLARGVRESASLVHSG